MQTQWIHIRISLDNMKLKFFRIASATLLVLLMLSVFILSNQTASESTATSSGFIAKLLDMLVPGFSEKSPAMQQEIITSLTFFVRKAAHFSLYALMGVLSFLTFISYKRLSLAYRIGISGLVCTLYAISDEIHQHFIEGRSCELRDVIIDVCGAFTGILFCWVICRIIKGLYRKIR